MRMSQNSRQCRRLAPCVLCSSNQCARNIFTFDSRGGRRQRPLSSARAGLYPLVSGLCPAPRAAATRRLLLVLRPFILLRCKYSLPYTSFLLPLALAIRPSASTSASLAFQGRFPSPTYSWDPVQRIPDMPHRRRLGDIDICQQTGSYGPHTTTARAHSPMLRCAPLVQYRSDCFEYPRLLLSHPITRIIRPSRSFRCWLADAMR
jgi:hypothetical protein